MRFLHKDGDAREDKRLHALKRSLRGLLHPSQVPLHGQLGQCPEPDHSRPPDRSESDRRPENALLNRRIECYGGNPPQRWHIGRVTMACPARKEREVDRGSPREARGNRNPPADRFRRHEHCTVAEDPRAVFPEIDSTAAPRFASRCPGSAANPEFGTPTGVPDWRHVSGSFENGRNRSPVPWPTEVCTVGQK